MSVSGNHHNRLGRYDDGDKMEAGVHNKHPNGQNNSIIWKY